MTFRILHYDTVDSTNNLARALAERGGGEGAVFVANYQPPGGGRFRGRWYSPRGAGLLFSIILRPRFQSSKASILTHVAAQAVRETLEKQFGLQARLKKPNDVVVGGKKIAGVLAEASGQQRTLSYVVIGIGLNVNTKAKDLLQTATSMYVETAGRLELHSILNSVLGIFGRMYVGIIAHH